MFWWHAAWFLPDIGDVAYLEAKNLFNKNFQSVKSQDGENNFKSFYARYGNISLKQLSHTHILERMVWYSRV